VLGKLFYRAFIHMTIVSQQLLALDRDYTNDADSFELVFVE